MPGQLADQFPAVADVLVSRSCPRPGYRPRSARCWGERGRRAGAHGHFPRWRRNRLRLGSAAKHGRGTPPRGAATLGDNNRDFRGPAVRMDQTEGGRNNGRGRAHGDEAGARALPPEGGAWGTRNVRACFVFLERNWWEKKALPSEISRENVRRDRALVAQLVRRHNTQAHRVDLYGCSARCSTYCRTGCPWRFFRRSSKWQKCMRTGQVERA